MASAKFRQDMPPAGGYGPIEWAQKAQKRGFGGYKLFAGYIGFSAFGFFLYRLDLLRLRKLFVEMDDSRLALEPFLVAEQDRAFLKQLRENRDEEAELMKDVPGWKVGTLYGEPVYHNPANKFPVVTPVEYYVHTKYGTAIRRLCDKAYH